MDCTTISELRCREVINLCDGGRLGFVNDVKIDLFSGRITALLLPPAGGVLGMFCRGEEICIPWECIERIGEDIILVRAEPEVCRKGHGGRKN